MGSLFLLLLIIFIVVPIARFAWSVYRLKRKYTDTVNRARREAEQSARRARAEARPGGWSAPRGRKSKIVDPTEGEYVEWEEVDNTVTAPETSAEAAESRSAGLKGRKRRTASAYVTERISDAEWTEIKQ